MSPAPANLIPPGITVFCDRALAPGVRSLGEIMQMQHNAPVSALSAPALSMLAQLQRHTRSDVLFTLSKAMDLAVQYRLVRPETRIDGFVNPLVLAGLANHSAAANGKDGLPGRLAGMRLAVTDDTAASGLDGRAVLQANGLTQAAGRAAGAANTADVSYLVTTGAADAGLVYLTDVQADRRLMVLAPLEADPVLTTYAVAVNAKAVSPNAQTFLEVMRSGAGMAALRAAGLQVAG